VALLPGYTCVCVLDRSVSCCGYFMETLESLMLAPPSAHKNKRNYDTAKLMFILLHKGRWMYQPPVRLEHRVLTVVAPREEPNAVISLISPFLFFGTLNSSCPIKKRFCSNISSVPFISFSVLFVMYFFSYFTLFVSHILFRLNSSISLFTFYFPNLIIFLLFFFILYYFLLFIYL
jgi:hypothetical protein